MQDEEWSPGLGEGRRALEKSGCALAGPPLAWACISLSGHCALLRGPFDCGLSVRPQNKRLFSSNLKEGFFSDCKWILFGVF